MATTATKRRNGPDQLARWEECWEALLSLPLAHELGADLREEAADIVRTCRSQTRDSGIGWIEDQVTDACEFVREQLSSQPDDEHWAQLMAMLDGASAGLA